MVLVSSGTLPSSTGTWNFSGKVFPGVVSVYLFNNKKIKIEKEINKTKYV